MDCLNAEALTQAIGESLGKNKRRKRGEEESEEKEKGEGNLLAPKVCWHGYATQLYS